MGQKVRGINPSGSLVHQAGKRVSAVKSVDGEQKGKGWVEGYLVTWGNPNDTDLQGEFFTPRTEFCLDWFVERPVLYHHGLDGKAGLHKIGVIKSVSADNLGLWVQAQLDLRDRYAAAVYDMVKTKEFGWSSGSIDHLVKISDAGEIATWPIVEGSITPTPAQPAKTSVRAFKSLLVSDGTLESYLREFDNKVKAKSADYRKFTDFVDEPAYLAEEQETEFALNALEKEQLGEKSMNRRSRGRRGILPDTESIASRRYRGRRSVLPETTMSDDELLPIASRRYRGRRNVLPDEAIMADELLPVASRRYRSRRNVTETEPIASRRFRGRRNVLENSATQFDNQLAAQMDDIAASAADEIAAQLEDELSAQLDQEAMEKRAARAIRNRLMRKALRQITNESLADSNIVPGGTGEEHPEYLGETMTQSPVTVDPVTKRLARRSKNISRGRRNVMPQETIASFDDEQAKFIEEVAQQSYRSGLRRGKRSAVPEEMVASRRYRGRRNILPETTMSDDENFQKGFRSGWRARRNVLPDEAVMTDELLPTASRRYRSRRNVLPEEMVASRRYRSRRNVLPETTMAEDEMIASRRYRSRRNANINDPALMSEGIEDMPVASRARKSADMSNYNDNAAYWKRRALKADLRPAPIKSSVGRIGVIDQADRVGAYEDAFKQYLRKGLPLMTESEKYTLTSKQEDWGTGNGAMKSASFGDSNGAYKTYFGNSDASVGFAIPAQWVAELNKSVMTKTVMAAECRTRLTTSDTVTQASIRGTDARRVHAATVRWAGEDIQSGANINTIEDQYEQINIPVHLMMMGLTASNSALEDVNFSLQSEINEAFSEAIAVEYDKTIWEGDGQAKILGIVHDSRISSVASVGLTTIGGYVASGSADGIISMDTFHQMKNNLPAAFRARAKWYMSSDTALQIQTLKDANGNYFVGERNQSIERSDTPEVLLNRPIVYNEFAQAATSGNFPVLFADMSAAYVLAKRVDFQIRRFDDALYAERDLVRFIGRARVGGQLVLPQAVKALKIAVS